MIIIFVSTPDVVHTNYRYPAAKDPTERWKKILVNDKCRNTKKLKQGVTM